MELIKITSLDGSERIRLMHSSGQQKTIILVQSLYNRVAELYSLLTFSFILLLEVINYPVSPEFQYIPIICKFKKGIRIIVIFSKKSIERIHSNKLLQKHTKIT